MYNKACSAIRARINCLQMRYIYKRARGRHSTDYIFLSKSSTLAPDPPSDRVYKTIVFINRIHLERIYGPRSDPPWSHSGPDPSQGSCLWLSPPAVYPTYIYMSLNIKICIIGRSIDRPADRPIDRSMLSYLVSLLFVCIRPKKPKTNKNTLRSKLSDLTPHVEARRIARKPGIR